ncbi:hypothetical protein W97_04499 [Coniosporium apollinis CBS 100218]|uniref:DNA excision repair protein ERCC-6 n=1 Tax=Coniosporium apollinis (strain CBS 100218) TaxID=1168221 RepID=R7YUB2_CONA1|nr:uncharacterized protein W97_04499 [Coniosporium apollinis CBS 100218]EON65261.1 hypothetical protein W97_04499 [Coniosporium apollinis CBS 100218]
MAQTSEHELSAQPHLEESEPMLDGESLDVQAGNGLDSNKDSSPQVEDEDGDKGAKLEPLSETEDAEARLKLLATGVRDQDDLERDIGRQADQLLTEQADERDKKRLEKTQSEKQRWVNQLAKLKQRLDGPGGSIIKNKIRSDIAETEERIRNLDTEVEQIQKRISDRHDAGGEGEAPHGATGGPLPGESRRDFLIRTGKITPFSKMASLPRASSNLADVMLDAEVEEEEVQDDTQQEAAAQPMSHRNLLRPGFAEDETSDTSSVVDFPIERASKRRRLENRREARTKIEVDTTSSVGGVTDDAIDTDAHDPDATFTDDAEAEEDDFDDDFSMDTAPQKKRKLPPNKVKKTPAAAEKEDLTGIDDGDERVYQARLQSWVQRRREARRKAQAKKRASEADADSQMSGADIATPAGNVAETEEEEEWYKPHPTRPDTEFGDGFRMPGDIWPSLFDYQKTGVQWLYELYTQQVGGIVGDEMGLGKTIQVISFLAGLHHSKKLTKPIIVVTPATVMKQWVNEFHRWWPPLRVSILHTSGSGMMDIRRETAMEEELESRDWNNTKKRTKGEKAARRIVERVKRDGHVLVTTYSGLQSYHEFLIPTDWEYAVLDEGHKIRNPNAGITIDCKELRTANRVILSGTPMQNNLTELWSLFDFIFPMRLGTLVDFRTLYENPIRLGGYANASNLQVETAMNCAQTLKDTISPYLLQRFKVDVAADLPKKTERVLFCKLTKIQRREYEDFLSSQEMNAINDGKREAMFGIDILRKICNHPDLVQHKTLSLKAGYNYGNPSKSGKMQVVKALLEIWKRGGHKTLLFAQHRIMLDILEKFIKGLEGFNYRRMDGTTAIKNRQSMVDEFNNDPDLHVFLLTTKVGGLGVNLTGADRVIIYDPDWNPSTDVQARERAWRLGQKREVEIYRLMTAGTVEEKIYHRQIFKQFLSNKILRDPKQRTTFQLRDLHDLFTLGTENDGETETGSLFKGTEVRFSDKQPSAKEQGIPTPPTDSDSTAKANASTNPNDLTKVVGIARNENYAPADSPQTSSTPATGDGEASKPSASDDRLLSTIFARSGVHSALNHDTIIDSTSSKPKVRADPEIIAREARRVAADAARQLQRAGEVARTVPIGTPTWTGVVGTAGRPEERPRGIGSSRGGFGGGAGRGGGPSSSSILSNLAARQGLNTPNRLSAAPSPSSSRASTPSQQQPRGKDFLILIRDYLRAHGGTVYTQMLIDHFNRFCGTEQRTAEFKEMLKRIATLERGGRGRARWVLKEEYR